MSKERATRRARLEAERQEAALARRRRTARERRRRARRERAAAPFHRIGRLVHRAAAGFVRRSRGQRVVLGLAALALAGGLAFASTWGLRILVVGLTLLLLPVAWTLASPRR